MIVPLVATALVVLPRLRWGRWTVGNIELRAIGIRGLFGIWIGRHVETQYRGWAVRILDCSWIQA